jgi:hypothetical protein
MECVYCAMQVSLCVQFICVFCMILRANSEISQYAAENTKLTAWSKDVGSALTVNCFSHRALVVQFTLTCGVCVCVCVQLSLFNTVCYFRTKMSEKHKSTFPSEAQRKEKTAKGKGY